MCTVILLSIASSAAAQSTTGVSGALAWLDSRQNANGTWGTDPELLPRDTARVLITRGLLKSNSASVTSGLGWLANQRGFDANQYLAEQAVALALANIDATPSLERLALQRSNAGPDYGGFIDHTGNSYDSALALQALMVQETRYATSIAGVVTTLITRQNADGGWGFEGGFDSSVALTAEVLTALSSTTTQQAPPATIAAAQAYLATRISANGSIGIGPLETAMAFRALALSGYPVSATAAMTLGYLTSQQSPDGSWSGDAYITARVLEAYAANKPNLVTRDGDLTLSPGQVNEGQTVTASLKVTNTGAAASAATKVTLFIGDAEGRELASVSLSSLAAGESRTATLNFSTTDLTGTHTISAVVDPQNVIDELRGDDNDTTAALTVTGKPDLQILPSDIVTAPARMQPNREGTLSVTIRNTGQAEATTPGYAIYVGVGTVETLLKKATAGSIEADGAMVVSVPLTLEAGTHTVRVVADPDAQITEASESNNQASKSVAVTASANVDLRIRAGNVVANPTRPATGQSFTISTIVENTGVDSVSSKVAFYDGVPGAGGIVIALLPVEIASQSRAQLQITHVATAESRVIYAVADPDELLPEVDETNNRAYALLTDSFVDLVLTREGFVLPRQAFIQGQTLNARLVVRNSGILPATAVRVVVYDDVPSKGGIKVVDTTVNVPAGGKTVVPVSWTVRAGQRFATAIVNEGNTLFEPDYANNTVAKLYTPRSDEGDIALSGVRASAVDRANLIIDQDTLRVSGNVAVNITTAAVHRPFTVTLFEDVDGDFAFHPEIDAAIGSTLVEVGQSPQRVVVNAEGTVRFAPGKLVFHLDSSNAIRESVEVNNFVDVWQDCQSIAAFEPGIKWRTSDLARNLAPVARFRDTNGDDLVDDNDVPYIVHATGGAIALHRGDTGQRLWIRNFGFFGRQLSTAIGDLDGDGVPEILAANFRHRIVALDIDGNTKWQSEELGLHPDWEPFLFFRDFTYVGAPAIADLEGDGTIEVIVGRTVLRGANGTIKWVGSGSSGRAFNGTDLYGENFPDQEAPITADLNGDGKLEVIAGSTAYRPDGTILWHRADLADGYAATVTLAGDVTPSIALVAHGRITMLRSDGTTRWGPTNLPNGARMGGAPTVFMDGATGPWVGVAGDGWYTVFNATTGAVRWTRATTTDLSFGVITTNAATAYDFGMGMTLAYAARHAFYLLRASDGAILYEMPNEQSPFYPTTPVIADIDGDGRTDIAVPGTDGMKILSDPRWNGTRGVFNQLSYNTVNVANDRAVIPALVTQTAFSKTHFRTNTPQASTFMGVAGQPNLTASYMRADTSAFPENVQLTVRAGNNGWLKAIDTTVAFYRVSSGASTLAGVATLRELTPGEYEDVTLTFENPPEDTTAFYAVVDDAGTPSSGQVAECNESDNRSQNLAVRFRADIAVVQSLLGVTDPLPRQGEQIEFAAIATLSGAVNASQLLAQFYLGDPSAGGEAISGLLPTEVTTRSGQRNARVSFPWTVTAPAGNHGVYVVFDPANVIAEDTEDNNRGTYSLAVSTSDPLRKLSGSMSLTPPTAEPGNTVEIEIFVQNIGNVALENVVLQYVVSGGSGSDLQGSATIASIAKNGIVSLNVGQFVPTENGQYTVAVTPADPDVTLIASAKRINIAPFASGAIDVAPQRVPIGLPMIQAHSRVSRTNTIALPDDPLVPLVKTHLQKGVNWLTASVEPQLVGCYKCHVHAQALTGLEASQKVAGITVNDLVTKKTFDLITQSQNANGSVGTCCEKTATTTAAWALSHHADGAEAAPALTRSLNHLLNHDAPDGGYTSDLAEQGSLLGRETPTMFAMVAYARGYEITRSPVYQAQLGQLTRFALAYDYQSARTRGPEYAARMAIGLAHVIPYLEDAPLKTSAERRLQDIALFLRNLQNPDGTFGTVAQPDLPVIRTAQSLYTLALAGAQGNDPALRSAIVWLLNAQRPEGGWSEVRSQFNEPIHWFDETTWAVIALPVAFARLSQFDVNLRITVPDTSKLVSVSPPANSSQAIQGGRTYLWELTDVSETGRDVYLDLELTGISNDEIRAATGAASVEYRHPYGEERFTRSLSVPTVTGFAPLDVTISTDAPSYPSATPVAITEVIRNLGSTTEAITSDVVIQDANGLTIATVTANEPVTGLPHLSFAGWNYTLSLSTPVERGGLGRVVEVPLDFAGMLAQVGSTSLFDVDSIRVTADASPASELYHSWIPAGPNPAVGNLLVTVPDDALVGSTVAMHLWFDTVENGLKPVSEFAEKRASTTPTAGTSGGFHATYWNLDRARSSFAAAMPGGLSYQQPPILTTTHPTSAIFSIAPAGVPQEFWATEWTGAIYAPLAGTYQFLLGSDEGSWLYIDDRLTINNGLNHALREVTTSVALTAGFHSFRVVMFNWGGPYSLYLKWAQPGRGFEVIEGAFLYPALPAADREDVIIGAPARIEPARTSRQYVWNTGTTAAGNYSVRGTLKHQGRFADSDVATITITPSSHLTGTIATDKPAYDEGEVVHLSAVAHYESGNVTLANVAATVSVVDSSGVTIASAATPIASLLPGQSASARLDWPAGANTPGSYTARLIVKDAGGTTLAQANVPFELRPASQSGKGVTGTISAPASVQASKSASIAVSLTNNGNAAIADGPFSVVVLHPQTQEAVATLDFTASIAVAATQTATVTWQTTSTTAQVAHDVYLVSRITATPVPLAQTTIRVTEPPLTRMSATVTASAPLFDCNDNVSITATATYDEGDTTRENVSVVITVTDSSSAVVATGSDVVASFAVGQTLTAPLNWTTGSAMPGTYNVAVVVRDSEQTFAQAGTSFEIRSSAVTGRCLTGSIAPSTPSVFAGDPFPFVLSVVNGGNAALSAAPFAVVITNPSDDSLIYTTLNVSVAAAKGATFNGNVSWTTTGVTPRSYLARLVSLITEPAVSVAETTVEVKERPSSTMSATVSSTAPAYDCNDTAHVTAAVSYTAGNVTRTDVMATITIAGPGGTTVASGARTAATFAVGETLTATLNWATTISAPGTYTVTVVVADANEVFAQAATSFEVRSSAATGKCLSGSITASTSSVNVGEPVPFALSVVNGGNAALSAAPFAVLITNPSDDSLIATRNVSVDAAKGATFNGNVSWTTTGVTPHIYRARLVSLITGTAVSLAETQVEVKAPSASSMSARVSTDASAYDCNAQVSIEASVSYDSGNITRSNVTATLAVVGPGGALVATGARTAATFAVGDTLTVPLQWTTGTATPGTYTVTVIAADGTATYAQAATSFQIRSSASTGVCITGSLSAPQSVDRPAAVPFSVTVTNGGNAALSAAPFAIVITHPTTGAAVATLSLSASVGKGAVFTSEVAWPTSAATPQFYRARLVSLITGTAVVLAETMFEVKAPSFALDVSVATRPRVLLWRDCAKGKSNKSCTPTEPPFIATSLRDAGIRFTLVGTSKKFIDALRTGGYSAVILYQPYDADDDDHDHDDIRGAVSPEHDDDDDDGGHSDVIVEALESMRAGIGLLYIDSKDDDDDDDDDFRSWPSYATEDEGGSSPRWRDALGVHFEGRLRGPATVNLLATSWTSPGRITFAGDGLKIELRGATAAGKLLSTGQPAIAFNRFGEGRTVTLPFDPEVTRTADVARFLVSAVNHVSRTTASPFAARAVVPVHVDVTTPPGAPASMRIKATLPAGVTLIDALPTTAAPPSWTASLPGGSTSRFAVWVRLPDAVGSSVITAEAGLTGGPSTLSKTLAVNVGAGRTDLLVKVKAALETLKAQSRTNNDTKRLSDALGEVRSIEIAGNPTRQDVTLRIVERTLAIAELLSKVSLDTTVARRENGRLLHYWQSRLNP
ncbi:MAG TPA: CARDB domain-containing protein [Thermoanaerobaculia bacterium]|nr:CARDB domain-containing protein [Thermoanaerobaculia bacterium]